MSKEVSAAIWSSNVIKTYPAHSEIHCAALVKSSPELTACLWHKETSICELGYIDADVAQQPNPVKVKFRLSVQVNGEQATIPCPSTHPYSFLDGKKCCTRNLESDFMNKATGSRGLLLHNSTTCGFESVYCSAGWICTPSFSYKNRFQIPFVSVAEATAYNVPILSLDDCQSRCEEESACKGWVLFISNNECHLKSDVDSKIVIKGESVDYISGFKSTVLNIPLE